MKGYLRSSVDLALSASPAFCHGSALRSPGAEPGADSTVPHIRRSSPETKMTANPLLETWTTPFDRIRPEHVPPAFDQGMAEHLREAVWISSDLRWHTDRIAELGFDEIQLHQVGRNQRTFVDAFGGSVLPALRRR